MAFTIRVEDVRNPGSSEVVMLRDEEAIACDGIECGTVVAGEDGTPVSHTPMTGTSSYPATFHSPRPAISPSHDSMTAELVCRHCGESFHPPAASE
jgi:hypothetical protein